MQETITFPQLYVPKPAGLAPKSEDFYGPGRRELILPLAYSLTSELRGQLKCKWGSYLAFAEHIAPILGMKPHSLATNFFQYYLSGRFSSLAYLLVPPNCSYELNPTDLTSWERMNVVLRELPFVDNIGTIKTLNKLIEGVPAYWNTRRRN